MILTSIIGLIRVLGEKHLGSTLYITVEQGVGQNPKKFENGPQNSNMNFHTKTMKIRIF